MSQIFKNPGQRAGNLKFWILKVIFLSLLCLPLLYFNFLIARLSIITLNIQNFKFPALISGIFEYLGHLGFCLGWLEGIFQLTVHHYRWPNVLFLGLHTLWRVRSSSPSSFMSIQPLQVRRVLWDPRVKGGTVSLGKKISRNLVPSFLRYCGKPYL